MWKDYSASFIKNNRASSVSIMVAAFISALFLYLLCSLFFNLWNYEVERVILEEGDWQGRIIGELDENDLTMIQNFANVEKAVVNEEISEGPEIAVDLYFQNTRTIYQDMPLITEKLGFDTTAASYHELKIPAGSAGNLKMSGVPPLYMIGLQMMYGMPTIYLVTTITTCMIFIIWLV